jgi:hypothetical protein
VSFHQRPIFGAAQQSALLAPLGIIRGHNSITFYDQPLADEPSGMISQQLWLPVEGLKVLVADKVYPPATSVPSHLIVDPDAAMLMHYVAGDELEVVIRDAALSHPRCCVHGELKCTPHGADSLLETIRLLASSLVGGGSLEPSSRLSTSPDFRSISAHAHSALSSGDAFGISCSAAAPQRMA